MRIGTNHGSLSDRILSRYGDTPMGMVESAMEFLRICENHSYHNIVLSMKSSNPIVMVQAYRLLINKMMQENMNYPLHLGVTEAGEGMEGRIKSSIGFEKTLYENDISASKAHASTSAHRPSLSKSLQASFGHSSTSAHNTSKTITITEYKRH